MLPTERKEMALSEKREALKQQAMAYIESSKSDNTKKAYYTDWQHFVEWCNENEYQAMPATPETIYEYISDIAKKYKFSTLRRRLASISQAHQASGYPSPVKDYRVQGALGGIARTNGTEQTPKKAVMLDEIARMIDTIDTEKLIGKRDKAILLVGFATASRRSELVAIDIEDITFTSQGMDIAIKQTKTHEVKRKAVLATNGQYCPVRALREWIEAAGIVEGAVFRSLTKGGVIGERTPDKTVANVVKKVAQRAGLNPADYAGHSLRSGLATAAAQQGMNDAAIMKQTGHKTRAMVDRYTQEGQRYQNNASSILFKI